MSATSFRNQHGAILVTSMLMLLVLTIIGVTAMQMTRMQERMAGNTRDQNLAFQGSESSLRNGEQLIRTKAARPDTCAEAPCEVWQRGVVANPHNSAAAWWTTNALEFEADGDRASTTHELTQLEEDPRFLVESIGFVPDSLTVGHTAPEGRDFFQVTGRSTGASGQANTVLRTTYARRF